MSFQVIKEPNLLSFVGNPIEFEVVCDSADDVLFVDIAYSDKVISTSYHPYKVDGLYKVIFSISSYLVHDKYVVDLPVGNIIQQLEGFGLDYSVKIGDGYTFSGTAFRGGISKLAYTQLADKYYNIFTFRLNVPYSQFLFTTRTNSEQITIRKTELHPFVFISSGLPLQFKSLATNNFFEIDLPERNTICTLDLQAVIDKFNADFTEDPTTIEIRSDGVLSFRFKIVPGATTEERYLIRFVNSLGAPEVIEVSGRLYHTPEASEEYTWQALSEHRIFEEKRSRVNYRQVLEVESGYKTRQEHSFIQDLIRSDKSFLIFPDGTTVECLVSAEEIRFGEQLVTPGSIPLTVKLLFDESFVTPNITADIIEGEGIFDDSFDDTFE